MKRFVSVAIDGPAGAGKSTMARAIAKEMGFVYVDTGAIYRTVGYYVNLCGIGPKDVDGVTNSSRLIPLGADVKGYLPCTAEACVVMLRHFDVPLAGKRAVVVGRSAVVGQPLSLLLLT